MIGYLSTAPGDGPHADAEAAGGAPGKPPPNRKET